MKPFIKYPPFLVHGSQLIAPINTPAGTVPIPITCADANRMFRRFLEAGVSQQSSPGATLWVIITACNVGGYKYTITKDEVLDLYTIHLIT